MTDDDKQRIEDAIADIKDATEDNQDVQDAIDEIKDIIENNRRNGRGLQGLPDIPASIDHSIRDLGNMNPVKDQGSCGSCWAFAATAQMEGTINALFPGTNQAPISNQQLVDCTVRQRGRRRRRLNYNGWDGYYTSGCNGGFTQASFDFQMDKGWMLESDYPYTARDGRCRHNDSKATRNIESFDTVTMTDETVMRLLMEKPLSVAIVAGYREFYLYESGLVDPQFCTATYADHTTPLVGFTQNGIKENDVTFTTVKFFAQRGRLYIDRIDTVGDLYDGEWLLQNQWGTDWGEDGFYRMAMAPGEGVCKVNTEIIDLNITAP